MTERDREVAELHVSIYAHSYETLMGLGTKFSLDLVHRTAKEHSKERFSVHAFVSRRQVEELTNAGYEVEILKNMTDIPDPREQVSKENRFKGQLDELRRKRGGA